MEALIWVHFVNNADFVNSGEEMAHEEEVLAVVNVTPGRMGRIIGKKGSSILSIKQSCRLVSLTASTDAILLHALYC